MGCANLVNVFRIRIEANLLWFSIDRIVINTIDNEMLRPIGDQCCSVAVLWSCSAQWLQSRPSALNSRLGQKSWLISFVIDWALVWSTTAFVGLLVTDRYQRCIGASIGAQCRSTDCQSFALSLIKISDKRFYFGFAFITQIIVILLTGVQLISWPPL